MTETDAEFATGGRLSHEAVYVPRARRSTGRRYSASFVTAWPGPSQRWWPLPGPQRRADPRRPGPARRATWRSRIWASSAAIRAGSSRRSGTSLDRHLGRPVRFVSASRSGRAGRRPRSADRGGHEAMVNLAFAGAPVASGCAPTTPAASRRRSPPTRPGRTRSCTRRTGPRTAPTTRPGSSPRAAPLAAVPRRRPGRTALDYTSDLRVGPRRRRPVRAGRGPDRRPAARPGHRGRRGDR